MEFVYKGLKAEYERHIVTDAELDQQLERMRQQNPKIEVVTGRPTWEGDEVVLDYAGFCDGEQFAGGTAQNQTLTLGSGTFIPGFEDQLLGKNAGDEVDVNVTFPENYHAENLAGKAAVFRCTVHEIRCKSAYALDDTFAKEVGGFDTLAQLRAALGEELQRYCDNRGEMDLQDRLLRQAADTLEARFDEAQLQQAMDQQMQNLSAQLAQQGLNLQMYCQFMGTTEDALRREMRPAAEAELRTQAAIDRIVLLEGLQAEKPEINRALEGICRQNRMTMEQLMPYYDEEFARAVERSVLTGKVMELIRAYAVIG